MALLGASALASLRTFAPEGGSGGGDGKPAVDPSRFEASIGGGTTSSVEDGKATTKKSDGLSMEFDKDGAGELTGIGDGEDTEKAKEKPQDGEEGTEDKTEPAKEETSEEASDAPYEPLPDYTEETAAAYDERFIKKSDDGEELNFDAIEAEIRANMAKAEGATERPNEGTYKFLKAKFGITKGVVDDHIEGKKLQAAEITKAFHEVTGGQDVWNDKLAWASSKDGKPGGYTKAQVDAFNAAMAKGGEAAAEQIELMNARFAKANPEYKAPGSDAALVEKIKREGPSAIGIKRRDASPKATAAEGAKTQNSGGSTGAKPFANATEHREAMANIRKLPQAQQETEHLKVRARLAVSPWWRKGK
jgi:hypothetical protein